MLPVKAGAGGEVRRVEVAAVGAGFGVEGMRNVNQGPLLLAVG